MVSHRSGETEDTFIADLVVGLCAGQVSAMNLLFCWIRDHLQISQLILTKFKQIINSNPPGIIRKPQVFRRFPGNRS